ALARSARPLARALAARLGPPLPTGAPPAPAADGLASAASGRVSLRSWRARPMSGRGGRSMANSLVRRHEGTVGQ
ncbi:MAG: hypothetical protein ACRD0N_01840, partial [Acidimicrobiales bacterium]